jgi:LCP family protein required for cell wall assembly
MDIPSQTKLTKVKTTLLVVLMIVSSGIGFVSAKMWQGSKSIFISSKNPVSQLASLIGDGSKLDGQDQDQVNVLLLGIGGEGHDGPYLSDTIMVASIKPKAKQISLISIPRDTLVNIPDFKGKYKINHAYALPTARDGYKAGLTEARDIVSDFTGLDIPYAVVVDFKGFVQAVDHLSGIDVTVPHTFTDSTFPNDKNGYIAPVTFKAGVEHMTGSRALIFARSRHSTSDFDRALRQQQIIEAFTTKVKDLNIITDISTVNKLFGDFTSHVWTNMDAGQVKKLGQLTSDIPKDRIYSSVLDPNTGLTCSYTSIAQGYHLDICPGKTADDIHEYIRTSFARGQVPSEAAAVDIYNGTTRTGLGQTAAEQAKAIGFKASSKTATLAIKPEKTMVYDMTGGKKPNSLSVLLATFSGEVGKNPPVSSTSSTTGTSPDFIVVLGRSYVAPNLATTNLDPKPVKTVNPEDAIGTDESTGTSTGTTTPTTPTGTTTPATGTTSGTTTTSGSATKGSTGTSTSTTTTTPTSTTGTTTKTTTNTTTKTTTP